jgi:5-methylcytosine-specific restriction endonuclease McrA
MKTCSKCRQEKPLADFRSDSRRASGVAASCKECSQEYCRQWRLDNPDAETTRAPRIRPGHKELSARWRKDNPERHRANDRLWRKANPEKARAVKAARKARKLGNGGRHTGDQIKLMLISQKLKCPNCRKSIKRRYHVDHVVPLSLGGSNDISNIQLLCPSCNLAKRAKPPEVWARENGRLL